MESLMALLEWWNLMFGAPLLLAGILILVELAGGFGHGTDADHEIGHEVEHEIHAEGDHDHDHDHDAEHEAGEAGGFNPIWSLLGFMGVGKGPPLSIILICFCLFFGVSGLASNHLLADTLRAPEVYALVSLAIALAVSIVSLRILSGFLARLVPSMTTDAVRIADLVGLQGTVTLYIEAGSPGQAQVYDRNGGLHQVRCSIEPGSPTIRSGEKIMLLSLNEREREFIVCPLQPLPGGQAPRQLK